MVAGPRTESGNHKLWIDNRKEGGITGVLDVLSFDLEEIVLETVMGVIRIKGKDLHVKGINLDRKEIFFEGMVNEFVYADSKAMKKQNLLGRLFG
ncbi:MAG: sporulation protein YabP [Lachnospiraceae bacterium]|nr:sporulation protein YabP [Lachnospiraceae bacterium]